MAIFGLSVTSEYALLSEEDLDGLETVRQDFPTCGNRQMQGHLLARGYRVQQ